MLLLLFGNDTFRSRAKLSAILKRYEELPRAKKNLRVIDCPQASLRDVQEELSMSSLFQEKKFLILKNVFQNKDAADALFEQKEMLRKTADAILFLEEGERKEHPLFLFLQEHAKSQEFKPLARTSTLAWAEKEFQKYGKTIGKDALALLVDETGSNLWRLSQEILKLTAFLGARTIVKAQDIKNILRLSLEAEIFSTLQAIALQDKEKALAFLSLHIKKGDEPLRILSMIAMQFRRILEVQDLKKRGLPLAALSLHPYAAKKTSEIAQNFSGEKLSQSFEKVFETDKNIKTGRMKPASALYQFAAQV